MNSMAKINEFTAQKHIAVVGISRTPQKFGNAIFRELSLKGYTMYPVSVHLTEFEGVKCFPDIHSLPDEVTAIVINTKPDKTAVLLSEARKKGIGQIWLQQGSTNKDILRQIRDAKENIITGHCIIMFTNPTQFFHKLHTFIKKVSGSYPK